MNNPKISIVIPVLNGIATIENCIKGIQRQSVFNQCEIIVIDSGSTDGTLNVLKSLNINVISIAPETFNHGATRNLGVSKSRGEFVLMTVQDAVAENEFWIEKLLQCFTNDEVAGVCGKQVVPSHLDKNPHEWARPISEPKPRLVKVDTQEGFNQLSPLEKKKMCSWDDVNAMYRKVVLLEIPFQPLVYGEDMLWAKMALIAGYTIVYEPGAIVNHYHYQFPEYTYKRKLISQYFAYKLFAYKNSTSNLFKIYLIIIYRNLRWRLHSKWILHNIKIAYNSHKASKEFNRYLDEDRLDDLEKKLSLSVPIGKHKDYNK